MSEYGYVTGGSSPFTEKYNDTTDIWSPRANLNTSRTGLAGFSLNGYGYTVGGSTGSNSSVTEKYNDTTDIWSPRANLNTARYSLAGFSLNGYGYAIGGYNGTASYSNRTEKYDDTTNTWSPTINLIIARYSHAGFSLNGYGYVTGGWSPTLGGMLAISEKYNPSTNSWTNLGSSAWINNGRWQLAGFSLNGHGYVAGGDDFFATYASTEMYSDTTNTWTIKASLNTAKTGLTGFSSFTAPANITMQNVTVGETSCTSGCNIGCQTSCPTIVDIVITWTNSGGSSGTFTPSITIAGGSPIPGTQITILPLEIGITTFSGVSLPEGAQNVCIDTGTIT